MTDISIIDWLLSNHNSIDTKGISSLEDWKSHFFGQGANWTNTVDKAIAGGFTSDRIAYAFASGYWSALTCLIPSLPDNKISALCVTEKKGNHPSSIHTSLKPVEGDNESVCQLNGNKSFVTCANDAELLLIAASVGTSSTGQNKLRIVRVDNSAPGMSIHPLKDLPFIPEISHGELELNNVMVYETQILPGDGYADYIKPFRTLEDIHITSAILGHLFRIACLFSWPQKAKSRVLAFLSSIKSVSVSDPLSGSLHILVGGISSLFELFIESVDPYWKLTDKKTRSLWNRDKKIVTIAEEARKKRLLSAWAGYQ